MKLLRNSWRFALVLALFLTFAGDAKAALLQRATSDNLSGDAFCPARTLGVCGINYHVDAGNLGAIVTFDLPEIFENRAFMVQCVNEGGGAYYRLTNNLTCEKKKCKASNIIFCDKSIPVSAEVQVGQDVNVSVPQALLAIDAASAPQLVARCAVVEGALKYEPVNAASVSCHMFSCEPTELSVCNSTVRVDQPSALGAVLQLQARNGASVIVQCLGTGGNAPRYAVTDHACP